MQSALLLPSHVVRSCRLIAGRRYAPFRSTSTRYFHQSLFRQSRPLPDSNGSSDANHDTPKEVKPAAVDTQSSEQERDTTSPNQSSAGRKSYIAGLRRTWKDKKFPAEDTPVAAAIPEWFLKENVITYGQVDRLESPTPILVDVQQKQAPQPTSDDGVNNLLASAPESGGENGKSEVPESTVSGGRYVVSSDSWEKLQAAVRAGFMFPSAKYANDPATERSHLLVRYPGTDETEGTLFLNAIVHKLAKEVEADLVTLNAQDIARLCSEQERAEGGAVSSIRNLGYEVYSDWKRLSKPDVGGELPDEMAGDDVESSFPLPGSSIRPRIVSVESNLPDTQLPNWLLSLTGNGADSTSTRGTRTETGAWLRLINQLMSLSSQPKPVSSNGASEPVNETAQQSNLQPRIIIHIQDYLEVMKSREGSKFLRLFFKTIHSRRREGQRILLIGTSSQPRNILADPTRAKKINEQMTLSVDSSAVPFGFPLWVVPAMETPTKDRLLAEDRKAHIRQTNIRNIQDMIRKRVDHDAIPIDDEIFDMASWPTDTDTVPDLRLDSHYWFFSSVHHHITLAMGCVQPNETFSLKHIQQASTIRARNIGVRDEWIQDPTSGTAYTDTSGAKSSKVDAALQLGCNKYEKKLLSGVVKADSIRTTFSDVHVPPGTIEALKTLTSLSLIRPDAFTYGVLATDKIPGMLLYGPPGTGKTLLAKAVARESGATVLEISGSDVYDMYVGEGEKNVRAIFTLAKKLSPCVVFIDEADAIFGSRNQGRNRPTSHRELINQFLREWDGMNDMSAFIMVATNRPFDLDDAVLRRLPRRLLVDLPTEQDRESILKIHLKNEQLDPSVDLSDLAHRTPFYSGSDLKNVCVAAALSCVRDEYEQAASHTGDTPYQYPPRRVLNKAHFERAMEEISASINEDMSSLDAIRKFDEKYGDRKGRRKKNAAWGFMPVGEAQTASDTIRVRT
jgi:ATPase family associated with various cellular activities (AAA)/AAA+ lid domain